MGGSETHSLDTGLAGALGVGAAIEGLEGEGRGGGQVRAEAGEEGLEARAHEHTTTSAKKRKGHTLRSAELANCSMKPLTPRMLVEMALLVVGMP